MTIQPIRAEKGEVMRVKARINGENQLLVDALSQHGIIAKLVKGGIIVELPALNDPGVYEVPMEVSDAVLYLDLTEHGGGRTNTGSGTVVCGLSGKALRPYYVPRRGHLACNAHAYFCVPNAAVTVTGFRNGKVKIEEHRIVRDGNNMTLIESTKLWYDELRMLPETFSRFRAAAQAAITKAKCYHCRCVHFARVR
jgi:hypothetical protein